MKKEEIVEILSPLNFWGKSQDIGFKRHSYLKKLEEFLQAEGVILSIVGVRRAGKTYLARQLLDLKCKENPKEATLYVLLEDPKFEPYLNVKLLDDIYEAYRIYVYKQGVSYIVLDEIQNVDLWEKWVRMKLEKKEDVKIIITGSSSKLLSSELATVLTGRTLTLKVFPFDFREFLSFKRLDFKKDYEVMSKREEVKRYLIEYITYGGFPQVVIEEKSSLKNQLLKEIFEGIIYRDIVFPHKIKDVYLVRVAAELVINNFSSLISATRLRNILVKVLARKISPNSVVKILSFLEEAFLIFQLPIFSYKVKEHKLYPKKIYCIDPGLINAVTTKFTENIGRIYENIVALYLIKHKNKDNLFYWKSKEGYEVDFVVKEKLKIKQLIQVGYDLSNEKVKKREINSLIKASNELKCKELLVITEDYETEEKIDEKIIVYKPLWKWLIE